MGAEIHENKDSHNWYVFYVKAKHERKVEYLLNRDGFQTYLPLVKVLKQWAQRKKHIEEPLIKSYIFLHIRKNQVYNVLQTPGMVKVVRFNDEPAIIHQRHIDLIKELIVNKTNFEITNSVIKIGETIKLKSGPFKGQDGVVKEIRGKKKLLIALGGSNFTVEIEL